MTSSISKKPIRKGYLYPMKQKAGKIVSHFVKKIRDGGKYGETAARQAVTAVKAAKNSICPFVKVPMTEADLPYIYRFCETVVRGSKEPLSELQVRKALSAASKKHPFYDSELEYLKPFLLLAVAEEYTRSENEIWLAAVQTVEKMDFSSIFMDFSHVEKAFLTEKANIYRHACRETHDLYHARLRDRARKTGTDELLLAETLVDSCNEKGVPLHKVLPRRTGDIGRLFVYFLLLFTLLPLCVYGTVVKSYALFFLIPCLLFSTFAFAKTLLEPLFAVRGETILPKLIAGEALDNTGVLVMTASFLYGEPKDDRLFDKLEDQYLTNRDTNGRYIFGIVGDLPQSTGKTEKEDEKIIHYADSRIRHLAAKYGEHFALFIRGRRYSESENAYIGWERKRGSVLEVCRFTRNKKTSFVYTYGDICKIQTAKYLITLDGDTDLYASAVRDMAGVMLHPENAPVWDETRYLVTAGHAVLAPRVFPTLLSSEVSRFADLTCGGGGYDIYAAGGADFYQTVFDEGIFCGKGILDIDIFMKATDGFFPKNRILSHDLLEGNLTRSALATDIVLSDGTPKNAVSYYTRKHRWLRGDLQTAPYLLSHVKNEKGETVKNPMPTLGKCKILDNLVTAATPFFSLLALVASAFMGNFAFLFTLILVFSSELVSVIRSVKGISKNGFPILGRAVKTMLYRVMTLAQDACLFADAVIRTVYRFAVSHKNFLNWQTAQMGDSATHAMDLYIVRFAPSMMVGLVFFSLPNMMARLLGAFFVLCPFYLFYLSSEKSKKKKVCVRDEKKLRLSLDAMFSYFDRYVNEKSSYLPPDNVQFFPTYAVAMRTSPTNIGLYLLTLLAMRDTGHIDSRELYIRCRNTVETLQKLPKWNGHFYNWYDIKTLEVLPPFFVSTVDSGNFITSAVAFSEGLKEYVNEEPKLPEVLTAVEAIIAEADFRFLYDEKKALFYIGFETESGKATDAHYDTLMSESLLTSYYAVASGAVPRSHFFALSRYVVGDALSRGIASWSGTAFEYFMQAMLLPKFPHSLIAETLHHAFYEQKKHAVIGKLGGRKFRIFGISESAYFHFDGAMQYQYRPFGIGTLSLNPDGYKENVVAPYASYLMLEENPDGVTDNLREFEKLGMLGKYGFYEALDFDTERVGMGYAKIQSYMAHHLGMSIVSCMNLLYDGIFRKRFMENPLMRASEELLLEKMPTVLIPYKEKPKSVKMSREVAAPPEEKERKIRYPHTVLYPEMVALSNTKTTVSASSSGHIACRNGEDAVFVSDYDLYSIGTGFHAYIVIDGIPFPTVPLLAKADGYQSEFSFTKRVSEIEYRSIHTNGKWTYTVTLLLSVRPDREALDITCHVQGLYKEARLFLYFEPILCPEKEYLASKPFSGLFSETEYCEDENTLIVKRRPRNGEGTVKYLGIACTPSAEQNFFETSKDAVLPLAPVEEDFCHLAEKPYFSDETGPCILPAVTCFSGKISGRQKEIKVTLAMSYDREELLYFMANRNGEKKRDSILRQRTAVHLQQGAAGVSVSPEQAEHAILRGMVFGGDGQFSKELPARKSHLWRYGISGDNPMVLLRYHEGSETAFSAFREMLAVFKYMCIRSIRFDLAVLYRETDGYTKSVYRKLQSAVRRAGLENFISFSPGIHPILENQMTIEEKATFSLYAVLQLDLAEDMEKQLTGNPKVLSLSEALTDLLLGCPEKQGEKIPKPERLEIRTLTSGAFHIDGYLVKKPHGKAPFANVLANPNFGTVVTENSLGFTFSRNAALGKLTAHTADGMTEDGDEKLLLRIYDKTDGEMFLDYDMCMAASYVDVGFDSVIYYGKCDKISYEITVAIGEKEDVKGIFCRLHTHENRKCEVLYTVKPAMGERAEKSRFYRYHKEEHGIAVHRLTDEKEMELFLYSGDATDFYTDSAACRTDGKAVSGRNDMACVGCRFYLYDEKHLSFYLAAVYSETQKQHLLSQVFTGKLPINTEKENPVIIKTNFPLLDETVNKWCLHQTVKSRLYARSGFYQVSGAYGFRDQLQDALALLLAAPHLTKTVILRAASHQYREGDVQHFFHEGEAGLRSRCSDDFLWLIYAVSAYVKSTGDREILQIEIPFLVSPPLAKEEKDRYEKAEKTKEKYPLSEHLLRAYQHADLFGEHGLPLMGTHDWNDGMNRVGNQGKGESVLLAFFHLIVNDAMRFLFPEDTALLNDIQKKESTLQQAIRQYGYDGKHYLRAYDDNGKKIGSDKKNHCQIDGIVQAFAGIAAGLFGFEKERAKAALDMAYHRLFDGENKLIKLLTPPFDLGEKSPGYIQGYVPGVRENGAQYTHAAVFLAIGFLLCDMPHRGAEILFSICPAMHCQDEKTEKNYRTEPYAICGDVYTAENAVGRGGWSFYTGAAGWFYRAVIEFLCGFCKRENGFFLTPRLSTRFETFSLHVELQNTVYDVTAVRGESRFTVLDGKEIENTDFFPFDGKRHTLALYLPKE